MAEIGEPVLNGRYMLLRHVHGWTNGPRTVLGKKGVCRYCPDPKALSETAAHTIPEALGNKWITSADECDACNGRFKSYDQALADSVSPFLTLGGTKGKGNKVRQTGRTAGDNVITHEGAGLSISTRADPKEHVAFDPASDRFRLAIPIAGVPFRPRHAYKALTKIGLALLPDDELDNYQQLRAWLLDVNDTLDFPILDVALSFGVVGPSLPLVAASLLRRTNPADEIPHILLFICFGSVCLQIDLMSDHLEDHIAPLPLGALDLEYWDFGHPIHLNWSSSDLTPQPVETMVLHLNPRTCVGRFTPVFRAEATGSLITAARDPAAGRGRGRACRPSS